MLPDRVSNPGPLTYESGALPIALRGPAPGLHMYMTKQFAPIKITHFYKLVSILLLQVLSHVLSHYCRA